MKARVVTTACAMAALNGCVVGPDYHAPRPEAPGAWASLKGPTPTGDSAALAESASLARWWTVFNDAALNSLIERALAENHDLKIAAARVREARAPEIIAKAAGLPTLDARGHADRHRLSETTAQPTGPGKEHNLFSAGLDASWELDFFGRVTRATQAAEADYDAAVESQRGVLVTLVAEVARTYSEVRGFQRRLAVARQSVSVQQESVEVQQSRFDAHVIGELDLAQARALLESRRAQIPPLQSGLDASVYRLSVLIGREPGALVEELSAAAPIPPMPPTVPVGLPSELLRRRPDIRAAERGLAGATARIGVATADLFPRITINGTVGIETGKLAHLDDMDSRAWSIGPSIRWNIFNSGVTRANIEAANAREEQALATYQKTVLTSLEEVENRLTAYAQEQSRHRSLAAAVAADQRAVDLASDLYKAGVREFINVLDSQRALYDAQDQFAQSDVLVTTNLIALYKALGGGWDDAPQAGDAR